MLLIKKIISYSNQYSEKNINKYNINGSKSKNEFYITNGSYLYKGKCYILPAVINIKKFDFENHALSNKGLKLETRTLGKYKIRGFFDGANVKYGLLEYKNIFHVLKYDFKLSARNFDKYLTDKKRLHYNNILEPSKKYIGPYQVSGFFQHNYVTKGIVKYKDEIYLIPDTIETEISSIKKYVSKKYILYTTENATENELYNLKKLFPAITKETIPEKDINSLFSKFKLDRYYNGFKNNAVINSIIRSNHSVLFYRLLKQIDTSVSKMNDKQLDNFKPLFINAVRDLRCLPDIFSNLTKLAIAATLNTSMNDTKQYRDISIFLMKKMINYRYEAISKITTSVNTFFNKAVDTQETHQDICINYILDSFLGINSEVSLKDDYVSNNKLMEYIVMSLAKEIFSINSIAESMQKDAGTWGEIFSLPFIKSFFCLNNIDICKPSEKNIFIDNQYNLTTDGFKVLIRAALIDTNSEKANMPSINNTIKILADDILSIMRGESNELKKETSGMIINVKNNPGFFRLLLDLKTAVSARVVSDQYISYLKGLKFTSKLESLCLLCNIQSEKDIIENIGQQDEIENVLKTLNTHLSGRIENDNTYLEWLKNKGYKIATILNYMCREDIKMDLLKRTLGDFILLYQEDQFIELFNKLDENDAITILTHKQSSKLQYIAQNKGKVLIKVFNKINKEIFFNLLNINNKLLLNTAAIYQAEAFARILNHLDADKVLEILTSNNNVTFQQMIRYQTEAFARILNHLDADKVLKILTSNNVIFQQMIRYQGKELGIILNKFDCNLVINIFQQNIVKLEEMCESYEYDIACVLNELDIGKNAELMSNRCCSVTLEPLAKCYPEKAGAAINKINYGFFIDEIVGYSYHIFQNLQLDNFISLVNELDNDRAVEIIDLRPSIFNERGRFFFGQENKIAKMMTRLDKDKAFELLNNDKDRLNRMARDAGEELAKILNKMDISKIIQILSIDNFSVIHILARHQEKALTTILNKIETENNVFIYDILKNNEILESMVQYQTKWFAIIVNKMDKYKAFELLNKNTNITSKMCINSSNDFAEILKQLDSSSIKQIFKIKCKNTSIATYMAENNSQLFADILIIMNQEDAIDILTFQNEQNEQNENIINFLTLNNKKLLVNILKNLKEENLVQILSYKDNKIGSSVLINLSKSQDDFFIKILKSLGQDKIKKILTVKNDISEESVAYNLAKYNSAVFADILINMDKKDAIDILKFQNNTSNYNTALSTLSRDNCAELVRIILHFNVIDDELINLLNSKTDSQNNTVLYNMAKHNGSELCKILNNFEVKNNTVVKILQSEVYNNSSDCSSSIASILCEKYSNIFVNILINLSDDEILTILTKNIFSKTELINILFKQDTGIFDLLIARSENFRVNLLNIKMVKSGITRSNK